MKNWTIAYLIQLIVIMNNWTIAYLIQLIGNYHE